VDSFIYDDQSIKSGNLFVFLISCYAVYRYWVWWHRSDISAFTRNVIASFALIFAATACNKLWFFMARQISHPTETWHPLMYEWRWLLVSITSAGTGAGAVYFVGLIDENSRLKNIMIFSIAFIAAYGLGFY